MEGEGRSFRVLGFSPNQRAAFVQILMRFKSCICLAISFFFFFFFFHFFFISLNLFYLKNFFLCKLPFLVIVDSALHHRNNVLLNLEVILFNIACALPMFLFLFS